MTRRQREILEQQLARALRLALEPTDAISRERLAQTIEDIEFQLQQPRKVA
jgi:hypothetical protein